MAWGMEDPARAARDRLSGEFGTGDGDWGAGGRSGPPEVLLIVLVLVLAAGAIWFGLEQRRDDTGPRWTDERPLSTPRGEREAR